MPGHSAYSAASVDSNVQTPEEYLAEHYSSIAGKPHVVVQHNPPPLPVGEIKGGKGGERGRKEERRGEERREKEKGKEETASVCQVLAKFLLLMAVAFSPLFAIFFVYNLLPQIFSSLIGPEKLPTEVPKEEAGSVAAAAVVVAGIQQIQHILVVLTNLSSSTTGISSATHHALSKLLEHQRILNASEQAYQEWSNRTLLIRSHARAQEEKS